MTAKLSGWPGSRGCVDALEVALLNRSTTSSLLGALVISVLVFFLHFPQTRDSILFDDAADYMRAARAPIVATWLNSNSATPLDLLRRQRSDPEFKPHPWF